MRRIWVLPNVVMMCVLPHVVETRRAGAAAIAPPPCRTAVAPAPSVLEAAQTYSSGSGLIAPFGVVYGGRDEVLVSDTSGTVLAYTVAGAELRQTSSVPVQFSPFGLAVTPDSSYLVAAEDSGAAVFALRRDRRGLLGGIELLGELKAETDSAGSKPLPRRTDASSLSRWNSRTRLLSST